MDFLRLWFLPKDMQIRFTSYSKLLIGVSVNSCSIGVNLYVSPAIAYPVSCLKSAGIGPGITAMLNGIEVKIGPKLYNC